MKKIFLTVILTIFSSLGVFSQNSDDYTKNEFFVGYSNAIAVDDSAAIVGHGFNASGVHNLIKYLGIKADVSGTYDKAADFRFVPGFGNPSQAEVGYQTKSSIYNFVGGVQFKDNSTNARLKPFAHAMAGVGQYRFKVKNQFCTTVNNCTYVPSSETDTGFALVLGGGLDIKVSRRIDIRVVQFDLNSIGFKRSISNAEAVNTFRFSTGIVFR